MPQTLFSSLIDGIANLPAVGVTAHPAVAFSASGPLTEHGRHGAVQQVPASPRVEKTVRKSLAGRRMKVRETGCSAWLKLERVCSDQQTGELGSKGYLDLFHGKPTLRASLQALSEGVARRFEGEDYWHREKVRILLNSGGNHEDPALHSTVPEDAALFGWMNDFTESHNGGNRLGLTKEPDLLVKPDPEPPECDRRNPSPAHRGIDRLA